MELIKAPLAVMVPEQIGLLKIEIEQMSVKYFAIKSSEIKVFASPDMEFVKKKLTENAYLLICENTLLFIPTFLHILHLNYTELA